MLEIVEVYPNGIARELGILPGDFIVKINSESVNDQLDYHFFSAEEYIELLMEIAEEEILNNRPNIGDEELDLALNWTRKIMNPTWLSIMVFLSTTFFSLVFSLIASIFIKKEETLSEETE